MLIASPCDLSQLSLVMCVYAGEPLFRRQVCLVASSGDTKFTAGGPSRNVTHMWSQAAALFQCLFDTLLCGVTMHICWSMSWLS